MDRYYTTGEAAELLGYSRERVRLWIKSGQLPAGKPSRSPNGHHRISSKALREFQRLFDPELNSKPGVKRENAGACSEGARRASIDDTGNQEK